MKSNETQKVSPPIGGMLSVEKTPPFGAMIDTSPPIKQGFVPEAPPPFALDAETVASTVEDEGSKTAQFTVRVRRNPAPLAQTVGESNYELPFSVPIFSLEAFPTEIKWGLESPPPSPVRPKRKDGGKRNSGQSPLVPSQATSPKAEDDCINEISFPFAFDNSHDTAENGGNVDETYSIGHVIEICKAPPQMNFSAPLKGRQIVQNDRSPSSPQTLASYKEQLARFSELRKELEKIQGSSRSSSTAQNYVSVNH
jgi:hypothetical protein